jgi:hypothetical protein
MTTLSEAKKAINDRFIASWGATTTYTFANEEFSQPTADQSWVRLTMINYDGGQETMGKKGSRRYERYGLIIANIFTPIEAGTSKGDELGTALQVLFEGERFNGVVVNNSTIRDKGVEDQWYHTMFEAEFIFYETK